MRRLTAAAILLLGLALQLGIQPSVLAQEEDGVLQSERPRDSAPKRSTMTEEEYGFGEYRPTGGKNVYCYAIFIVFSMVTVFLAFRGNKKG